MRNPLITAVAMGALGIASAQTQNIVLLDGGVTGPTAETKSTRKVEFVDVDGDGDMDMVAINHGSKSIIYVNDGSGQFVTQVLIDNAGINSAKGVTFFNWLGGDSLFPEMIIATGPDGAGANQRNLFYENTSTTGVPSFALIPAGVNAPGDTDHSYDVGFVTVNSIATLIVANRKLSDGSGGVNRVYTVAAGVFTADLTHPISTAGPLSSRDIAIGDLDGDGDDDVLIANAGNGSSPNECYLNNGSALVLEDAGDFSSADTNTYGMAIGELDGDGKLDVVTANRDGITVAAANQVFANNSTADDIVLKLAITQDPMISFDVAIGDLDGDGDGDIVVANRNQTNEVFMNNRIDNSLGAGDLDTNPGAFFTEVSHGAIQQSRGNTLSVTLAEVQDYGTLLHQGMEVALANTNSSANFYYRGFGPMFVDLAGASPSGSDRLEASGFLSSSTNTMFTMSGGTLNENWTLYGSIAAIPSPLLGGLFWLDAPASCAVGTYDASGNGTIMVPAATIAALGVVVEGIPLYFQGGNHEGTGAITNALSVMVQD